LLTPAGRRGAWLPGRRRLSPASDAEQGPGDDDLDVVARLGGVVDTERRPAAADAMTPLEVMPKLRAFTKKPAVAVTEPHSCLNFSRSAQMEYESVHFRHRNPSFCR